jgi:3',5'-cyclic AMP phosphodiesterase CpdA
MKIIQFSDTHLRIDGRLSFGKADTAKNLNAVINFFVKMRDQPDIYVLTGDLVDNGVYDAYLYLKEHLKKLPRPVFVVPGNHDEKTLFIDIFGEMCPAKNDIKPFICYTLEYFPVNIIAVDTTVSWHHGGFLSNEVSLWLERQLNALNKDKPTLVFSHHPPFLSGISIMDKPFVNVDKYASILGKARNLKLCCGHLHTAIATIWHGIPVQVCPPVSMLLEVNFTHDADIGFFLGNPGYVLHHYCDGYINSHILTIPMGADYNGPFPFRYYDDDRREQ